MNTEDIKRRAQSLFNYLLSLVKLGLRVTTRAEDHGEFLLFENELPLVEGILLFPPSTDLPTWLEIYRQDIKDQPQLPPRLVDWVQLSDDPEILPQTNLESQIDGTTVRFTDDLKRAQLLEQYLDNWKSWAEETIRKRKPHNLYKKLFHVSELLKYDEQLELIWGTGVVLWRVGGEAIRYPIITRRMSVEHLPSEGIIRVLPIEDSDPRLELDVLSNVEHPDFSETRERFNESVFDPTKKDTYLTILREIAGKLSSDGKVESIFEATDLTPTNRLRIVDCWVLFVRKRQQDAVIRDIEEFINKLKAPDIFVPESLSVFLKNPDHVRTPELPRPLDEWTSLIDKQILFPLEANQEQIQILDRIDQSDGVVVWGPPGTGKSHTIANLICHFMANGKRVLVTSQKDQALAVLYNMLPDGLKSLCMNLLSQVSNSRQELGKAVDAISEIVTQGQQTVLHSEIAELEVKIDACREKLERTKNKMITLANAQVMKIEYLDGNQYLPLELLDKMNEEHHKHIWLTDYPKYIKFQSSGIGDNEVARLEVNIPITEEGLQELKKLWILVKDSLSDFTYETPNLSLIADRADFRKMVDGLENLSKLEKDISECISGLVFKPCNEQCMRRAVEDLEEALATYRLIQDDWQVSLKNTIRQKTLDSDPLLKAAYEIDKIVRELAGLYGARDPLKHINIPANLQPNELAMLVNRLSGRISEGKRPKSLFDIFTWRRKAIKGLLINDSKPSTLEDWNAVLHQLRLLNTIADLKYRWNIIATELGAPLLAERSILNESQGKQLISFCNKLQAPIVYELTLFFRVRNSLDPIIAKCSDVLTDETLASLHRAISIRIEQLSFHTARDMRDRVSTELQRIVARGKPHSAVTEMLSLLGSFKQSHGQYDQIIEKWGLCYGKMITLDNLRSDFQRFESILENIERELSDWAIRWRDPDLTMQQLCPVYWQESVQFNAFKDYLNKIMMDTNGLTKQQSQLELLTIELRQLKGKLISAKTRLSLIHNTTDKNLSALERWRLAVRKLGKGKGKYAWKKEKMVQKEMRDAQSAVPVWIMSLYRVSETVPPEFGCFDVVIIDEASQCDVRAFLAISRAKKIIVVGDPQQISPDAVGIPEDQVQRLIKEHLKTIPGADYFDLKTGLYDLAKITFSGQGVLMLKEHFRCVPEIIAFCNRLCYNEKILPLRNPSLDDRLEPVLESIFVEGGYREGRQDINKPEALKISETIKNLLVKPNYKSKSFGVISLLGYDQAKYITNIIDDFLTPDQQLACRFRAGDSYSFQGDERDVILLSMVVSKNDEKRLTSLTADVYRQRFNVAVSRARDKLILFHSVELRDLPNHEDLRYILLNYVQNGVPETTSYKSAKELFQSPFEEEVFNHFTRLGYRVTPQVQVGSKHIDLVIEDNKTRLGIECDGDRYHPPDKWWDDQNRERQLRRAGWNICRIWGSAFYRNQDEAIEPVLAKLKEMGIRPKTA